MAARWATGRRRVYDLSGKVRTQSLRVASSLLFPSTSFGITTGEYAGVVAGGRRWVSRHTGDKREHYYFIQIGRTISKIKARIYNIYTYYINTYCTYLFVLHTIYKLQAITNIFGLLLVLIICVCVLFQYISVLFAFFFLLRLAHCCGDCS